MNNRKQLYFLDDGSFTFECVGACNSDFFYWLTDWLIYCNFVPFRVLKSKKSSKNFFHSIFSLDHSTEDFFIIFIFFALLFYFLFPQSLIYYVHLSFIVNCLSEFFHSATIICLFLVYLVYIFLPQLIVFFLVLTNRITKRLSHNQRPWKASSIHRIFLVYHYFIFHLFRIS